ncbi:MAG TPA: hypothetical protein CFH81_06985 [Sulfurovum sp. UBA12169]|nr:MAG TPA: hypothetical protein CFH81_06985 [Sulfurovum sp. UBA12169]
MKNINFTPLEKRILSMALNDDNRLCSFYSKEIFEHINLADVIRKRIRIKLSILLRVDYDYVKDIIFYTETKEVTKRNGKKVSIGIYRLDKNFKAKVRALMKPYTYEVQES